MASKGSKVFEHLKQATTDFDENWAGNGSNSIDEDDTSDEAWKAANDLSNQAKAELDAGK